MVTGIKRAMNFSVQFVIKNVVIIIADENGFDGKMLFQSSGDKEIRQVLDRNTDEAIERSVFGSPTWIYQEELFWGQDRLEFLTRAVELTK